MFKIIIFILFVFSLSYFEYLWNSFNYPIVYLTIQQCQNQPSIDSLRSFFIQQYQKLTNLFFNRTIPKQCHRYKINLHLSLTLFIFNCLCSIYFIKFLDYLYKNLCYFILRKQTYPFVHIQSIALTNKKDNLLF